MSITYTKHYICLSTSARMRSGILLTVLLVGLLWQDASAQRWKKYRHEVIGGLGATSFLGEVGGGDGPGKDLFLDFDGKASRYLITGGYRYKLAEVASLRANLTYARLYGNDEFSGEVHRRSRNLHFRSPLIELAALGEIYFIREKLNSRYRVRGIRGALGSSLALMWSQELPDFTLIREGNSLEMPPTRATTSGTAFNPWEQKVRVNQESAKNTAESTWRFPWE